MTAKPGTRLYYGWVIVAFAWICFLVANSTTLYGFGLFTLPVTREFGLNRSQFNTGITIIHIADALVSPVIGWLVDRHSIRRVIAGGALALGVGLAVLGASPSLLIDTVVLAVLVPFGFISLNSVTNYALIARWFRHNRGRAMAIAAIGQSASGILGVPAISYLIDTIGWRETLFAMAAVTGVAMTALTLLIVIDRPRPGDVEPTSRSRVATITDAVDQRVWSAAELLRTARFWQFLISLSLLLGAITSIMLSLVPYGQALGMTTVRAATLISAISISSVLTKFAIAFIADRVDRSLLLAIGALALAGFCAVLLAKPAYPWLIAACLVGGFSMGTAYPLFAAIMADSFGSRSYGKVLGLGAPLLATVNAGAAKFVGAVHDANGNYDLAFTTYIATNLVAAALLLIPLAARRARHGPVPVEPGRRSIRSEAAARRDRHDTGHRRPPL